ncbi:hypothetical protein OUZ56_011693 [Daphnia magna]|uniref:Uncharacterized protein n=1 Tax=Daphnia magna TaxID=35525 RepID=A0ABQ9Z0W4_9CRUS|nr:hypothetical protein OUZ56_011693 [Daphnia magna]
MYISRRLLTTEVVRCIDRELHRSCSSSPSPVHPRGHSSLGARAQHLNTSTGPELSFDHEVPIDDLNLDPTQIWDRRIKIDRPPNPDNMRRSVLKKQAFQNLDPKDYIF